MSSAESEYEDDQQSESSSDNASRPTIRFTSRPTSSHAPHTPVSPRKRRRSESVASLHNRKQHLRSKYNDGYRALYNETITDAAARFNTNESFQDFKSQVGVAHWSAKEKSTLFAALEKLGRDDIPGIAKAISSKSVPEVREYLLLLQDASAKTGDLKVTLHDVPTALEVGVDCDDQLEWAADALAWFQEKFEAKQEQERFGQYWLITPDIAEEIEDAIRSSDPAPPSSPPSVGSDSGGPTMGYENRAQILQDIPEAQLLQPRTLLTLSATLFMNRSPDLPSPWLHWSQYASDLASEPSMYRTAFNDFYSLVVSLTKRLTQVAITQATSRLRSRRRKTKKGGQLFVKLRDVHTAIDLLGLERNGRERWRGVARRCGVRVFDGRTRGKREVPWDEAEQIMKTVELSTESLKAHTETAMLTSSGEDGGFRVRAIRSGTPLPQRIVISESGDEGSESQAEQEESDEEEMSGDRSLYRPPSATGDAPQFEINTLEVFDKEASRQEENCLWQLLGFTPPMKEDTAKSDDEGREPELKENNRLVQGIDDWRKWTEYRAEWEEFRNPVPLQKFLANQKRDNPATTYPPIGPYDSNSDFSDESGRSSDIGGKPKKRRKQPNIDIPVRGSRAYAEYMGRMAMSENQSEESGDYGDDESNRLIHSIEDNTEGQDWDEMDWDAEPVRE